MKVLVRVLHETLPVPHRFIAFGRWSLVVSYGQKGSFQTERPQRLPESDPFLWPASQKDELQGNQKEVHFGRPSLNEGTGCGLTKGGVGQPGKSMIILKYWLFGYLYIYILHIYIPIYIYKYIYIAHIYIYALHIYIYIHIYICITYIHMYIYK